MDKLCAIVMAGGGGKRFWPLSHGNRPKQLLKLLGDKSLLRMTVDRIKPVIPPEKIFVLTNKEFAKETVAELSDIPPENIIAEPLRRDTAAAVALGTAICRDRVGEDSTTAVLPADHHITNEDNFLKDLISAANGAEKYDALYTFGIKPVRPAVEYGYLETGKKVENGHYILKRFKEKPDQDTAEKYIKAGSFFWNSGIFVWTVNTVSKEIKKHLPKHAENILSLNFSHNSEDWGRIQKAFENIPSISIDYGIMEKADKVHMLEASFGWNDVGGFNALAEYMNSDIHDNKVRGEAAVLDCSENIIFCEDPTETVGLIGMKGIVVVRAGKKTLIAPRNRLEDIKKLVDGPLKNIL